MKCPHCSTEFEVKIIAKDIPPPKPKTAALSGDDVGDLLDRIELGKDALDDWERDFIYGEDGIARRYNKYKDKLYMSDKQAARLKKIAEKTF